MLTQKQQNMYAKSRFNTSHDFYSNIIISDEEQYRYNLYQTKKSQQNEEKQQKQKKLLEMSTFNRKTNYSSQFNHSEKEKYRYSAFKRQTFDLDSLTQSQEDKNFVVQQTHSIQPVLNELIFEFMNLQELIYEPERQTQQYYWERIADVEKLLNSENIIDKDMLATSNISFNFLLSVEDLINFEELISIQESSYQYGQIYIKKELEIANKNVSDDQLRYQELNSKYDQPFEKQQVYKAQLKDPPLQLRSQQLPKRQLDLNRNSVNSQGVSTLQLLQDIQEKGPYIYALEQEKLDSQKRFRAILRKKSQKNKTLKQNNDKKRIIIDEYLSQLK
ncbi:hypothetical protein SS50377_25764 [Spironucleus salmonicida]|uniref:Uncharacterized protein n=1 Tax=Spironucleus salmonicida TaxID=348837 RepID=V6LVJ2_9EUKA|nr:hypothetical protein SS50377_25764 [Spironucleus salmonicida]|eukprot:EST48258.1 Hypothetical protein SS50377_11600 [Spironucleus salmonicida]